MCVDGSHRGFWCGGDGLGGGLQGESVGFTAIEVGDAVVQTGGFHGGFEVRQRRFEDIVVVIMAGNDMLRIDHLDRLHTGAMGALPGFWQAMA